MDTRSHSHLPVILITFFLIIGSAGIFLWYLDAITAPAEPPAFSSAPDATADQPRGAASPTNLPASASPVQNPIGDAYKNPFE